MIRTELTPDGLTPGDRRRGAALLAGFVTDDRAVVIAVTTEAAELGRQIELLHAAVGIPLALHGLTLDSLTILRMITATAANEETAPEPSC